MIPAPRRSGRGFRRHVEDPRIPGPAPLNPLTASNNPETPDPAPGDGGSL